MKGKAAKSVDEYIAHYPPDVRRALANLRRTIREAAPEADEIISYQMPAYKYHGRLVYFAGFKNHCSLFVASLALMKRLGKDLEPYDAKGGTIHFTSEHPLPASLVRKIVKMRMKENEERGRKRDKA